MRYCIYIYSHIFISHYQHQHIYIYKRYRTWYTSWKVTLAVPVECGQSCYSAILIYSHHVHGRAHMHMLVLLKRARRGTGFWFWRRPKQRGDLSQDLPRVWKLVFFDFNSWRRPQRTRAAATWTTAHRIHENDSDCHIRHLTSCEGHFRWRSLLASRL